MQLSSAVIRESLYSREALSWYLLQVCFFGSRMDQPARRVKTDFVSLLRL